MQTCLFSGNIESVGSNETKTFHYVLRHLSRDFVSPVYTGDFFSNFCRTFRCNFSRAQVASSNRLCKLAAISVRSGSDLLRDVAKVSKPNAT